MKINRRFHNPHLQHNEYAHGECYALSFLVLFLSVPVCVAPASENDVHSACIVLMWDAECGCVWDRCVGRERKRENKFMGESVSPHDTTRHTTQFSLLPHTPCSIAISQYTHARTSVLVCTHKDRVATDTNRDERV